jgi:hypothetical protein
MTEPIFKLVNELPEQNVTVRVLNALDFVVPGEWENIVGFENTIRQVTGEEDEEMIQQIGDRAVWLFNDESQGYQRALWLYQTVDRTDTALASAALANKAGERIPLLGFLNNITPKADKAQSIDLALKTVVELVAFCQINGIPGDSIGDFVNSLADYGGEDIMRMAALVCLDGLVPLGPDFIQKAQNIIDDLNPDELEDNDTFQNISGFIPGGDTDDQLGFIGEAFDSVKDWMGDFVESKDLTPQKVTNNIESFVEFSDEQLDYLAAFLDLTTNYYEHTGTQTLARCLIERAMAEV